MTEIITRAELVTLAREYEAAVERQMAYSAGRSADLLATAVLAWDEQERAALLAGQVAAKDRAEQAIVRLRAADVVGVE